MMRIVIWGIIILREMLVKYILDPERGYMSGRVKRVVFNIKVAFEPEICQVQDSQKGF